MQCLVGKARMHLLERHMQYRKWLINEMKCRKRTQRMNGSLLKGRREEGDLWKCNEGRESDGKVI